MLFLEDLCTVKEISDMAQRLEAAKLLLGGRTYDQIVKEVEISTATISRINRCIQYGTGGYQSVIEKDLCTGEKCSNGCTAGDIGWGTPLYSKRMSPLWQRSIVPPRWNVRLCPVLP